MCEIEAATTLNFCLDRYRDTKIMSKFQNATILFPNIILIKPAVKLEFCKKLQYFKKNI